MPNNIFSLGVVVRPKGDAPKEVEERDPAHNLEAIPKFDSAIFKQVISQPNSPANLETMESYSKHTQSQQFITSCA